MYLPPKRNGPLSWLPVQKSSGKNSDCPNLSQVLTFELIAEAGGESDYKAEGRGKSSEEGGVFFRGMEAVLGR